MKKLKLTPVITLLLICFCITPRVITQTALTKETKDPLHQFNNSVRELVKTVTPSVVQITTTGYRPVEDNRTNTRLVLARQEGVGSGVIVDPDGYILTNAHVVSGANSIQVTIRSVAGDASSNQLLVSGEERRVDASIVGSDAALDLALLKVEAKGLKALPLSDYNKLRQGDVVFSFGSPAGLQDSVTMGVVSATARQLDRDSPLVFIQSDAPTNPGNSGGPLVNVDGELVGINTFILTQSGGNEGLGFSIPSAVVAFAYPQLRNFGYVHRGETGIAVQAITPDLAAALKIPTDRGVIISDVAPGTPAEAAGLKVQDIIISIDGNPAESMPTVAMPLLMRRDGERIKLEVLRDSKRLSYEVPVVELVHDFNRLAGMVAPDRSLVSTLGILAIEIDPKLAVQLLGVRIRSGVIVLARAANSNIDISLLTGDVIHAVNGAPVRSIKDLRSALDHLSPDYPAVLQIERDQKLMFVVFKF